MLPVKLKSEIHTCKQGGDTGKSLALVYAIEFTYPYGGSLFTN